MSKSIDLSRNDGNSLKGKASLSIISTFLKCCCCVSSQDDISPPSESPLSRHDHRNLELFGSPPRDINAQENLDKERQLKKYATSVDESIDDLRDIAQVMVSSSVNVSAYLYLKPHDSATPRVIQTIIEEDPNYQIYKKIETALGELENTQGMIHELIGAHSGSQEGAV